MGACPSLTETERGGILPERPQARGQQNRAQNLFPSRFSSEVLPPLRCWHPDLFLDRCQETSWEVSRQGGCSQGSSKAPSTWAAPGGRDGVGTCSETEQLRGSLQVYCLGIQALTSHPELQKGPSWESGQVSSRRQVCSQPWAT